MLGTKVKKIIYKVLNFLRPENRPTFQEVYSSLHALYKSIVVDVEDEENLPVKDDTYAISGVAETNYHNV
jgi:hypothetical protein